MQKKKKTLFLYFYKKFVIIIILCLSTRPEILSYYLLLTFVDFSLVFVGVGKTVVAVDVVDDKRVVGAPELELFERQQTSMENPTFIKHKKCDV